MTSISNHSHRKQATPTHPQPLPLPAPLSRYQRLLLGEPESACNPVLALLVTYSISSEQCNGQLLHS